MVFSASRYYSYLTLTRERESPDTHEETESWKILLTCSLGFHLVPAQPQGSTRPLVPLIAPRLHVNAQLRQLQRKLLLTTNPPLLQPFPANVTSSHLSLKLKPLNHSPTSITTWISESVWPHWLLNLLSDLSLRTILYGSSKIIFITPVKQGLSP